MALFVLKRIGSGFVLLLAISFITFAMVYAGGANIAYRILGPEASPEQVAAKAAELGLDQPLIVQYLTWLQGAVAGDLGRSWFSPETVASAISGRLSVTLSVVTISIIVVSVLSVILGIVAAIRRGWLDNFLQVLSVIGLALPNFWLALVLIVVFSLWLGVLPATGYVPPARGIGPWLVTLVLPVTAIAIGGVAAAAQQIRSAYIDVMRQDFIRTLRTRGLPERSVLFTHALKNASGPALTILSLQFIGMIGGAVVIEKVFALPGLGLLAVNATLRGDIPIIMGVVLTMSVIVVVVNLFIDLANGWTNPKARVA